MLRNSCAGLRVEKGEVLLGGMKWLGGGRDTWELGIAPWKEGSKSGCWRDPVNKSGSCSHVLPTSTVGNVSNMRKMVKDNWFESQQSNESETETSRWCFDRLVANWLDSNVSLLRTPIKQKTLLVGNERKVSMLEMWGKLRWMLHCIHWTLISSGWKNCVWSLRTIIIWNESPLVGNTV